MYWRVDYVRAVVADWPVTNKYHTSGIVISGPTEVPSAGQSRIEQCIIDLEVNRQSDRSVGRPTPPDGEVCLRDTVEQPQPSSSLFTA